MDTEIHDLPKNSDSLVKPVMWMTISSALVVRNLLQTGIIRDLNRDFHITAFVTPAIAETIEDLGLSDALTVQTLDPGPEPRSWRLLRRLKKKVYMEGRNCSTERLWEKYQKRTFAERVIGSLIRATVRLIPSRIVFKLIDRLDLKFNQDTSLQNRISVDKPVLMWATHATTFFEEVVYRNVRRAGIPCIYFVLSWDHLSSKVVLHNDYHKIFVWNRHTRRELLDTYPDYNCDQIEVVGIPQYDSYADEPEISYKEWCAQYGLTDKKRTIVFSTMPQVRHNQQHVIIEDLLRDIKNGNLPSDLQFLIKCHPWDNFEGYEKLLGTDKPVGIRRTKLPVGEPIEHWKPKANEIEESRDCLRFCTMNINIFSTVTIEAAFFRKPVIHIAYDPLPIEEGRIPCHLYYEMEHFKPIARSGASIIVRSFDQLKIAILELEKTPKMLEKAQETLAKDFIGGNVGNASNTVCEAIRQFCGNGKRRIGNTADIC